MTTQTSGLVDLVDMAERLERRDISCSELTATTLGHIARLSAAQRLHHGCKRGESQTSRDEHVGDFPVIMPAVAVSSIGAGGGSIAWIDRSGLLKVGPRSAGADPGPACYARGAVEPTLTDAFVLWGYVDPSNFLGGRLQLDRDCARSVLQPLAEQLGRSLEEAAEAVIEVSAANMYAEFS